MAPTVLSRDKTVKLTRPHWCCFLPVPLGHIDQDQNASACSSSSGVCGDGAAHAVWRCSACAHPHLVPGLLVLAWSPPEGLQLVEPH